MCSGAYETVMIAGAFTILGALIGGLSAYYLSRKLADYNIKLIAGQELREAFYPEMAKLQYPPSDITAELAIVEILENSFHKHYSAVKEFRRHLRYWKLKSFNEAWDRYYQYQNPKTGELGKSKSNWFSKYHRDSDPDGVKKAIKNIELILKFTE